VIIYNHQRKSINQLKNESEVKIMSIREVALAKKGTFATIEYAKEVKTLKGCPVTITKKTIARNVRIGCEYDSLKAVKDAKGVKTTAEAHELNTGLRGFEWINFPTILQNKKGDKFVRITTNSNTKFDTTYYANGIKVNKEDIEKYLPKSSSGNMPVVMNINMDNINYIH
jgi:hypothetical protein